MSDKAMFNNKDCRTCSRSDFNTSVGYRTGTGIPQGYVQNKTCRVIYKYVEGSVYPMTMFLRNANYNQLMTYGEYDKYIKENWFVVASGRNTYKYTLSRAARKRGYTTTDTLYNSRKARYSKDLG